MDRRQQLPFLGIATLVVALGTLVYLSAAKFENAANLAAVNAAKVATLTNDKRAEEGIVRLVRNSVLDRAAQLKAEDMATKGYYAHVSPDGLTPMHWVEKAGYKYLIIGENLVVNRTDAEQVVDAFMGSPGHRANILRRDFTEIGIGVATGAYKGKEATFTVQIFAAPYPVTTPPAKAQAPKAVVKPLAAPVKTPAPTKPAVASPVPRAVSPVVATTTSSVRSTSTPALALQQNVTELIRPLVSVQDVTSAIASSTATSTFFETPSFFLNESTPVGLGEVSRLEADTLPVPVGSTWSMQFRSLVDTLLVRARALLGS